MRPFSTRSPSQASIAGSTVSERDHRDRDHDHRPDGEGDERLVAADEHAGHRDHHGEAGDQHGAAGGRGGGLERGRVAAPGGALLALAAQVEERVVDADRQPDQQDRPR